MRHLYLVALGAMLATAVFSGTAFSQPAAEFKLGFKVLADQIPSVAGQPIEDEHYGPNGDSLQQTTTGLMAWRKADNWTAFTDGSRTWVNGPYGVMERGNDERFDWESKATPPTTGSPVPPVYVDNTPSEYDLSHSETLVELPEGQNLLSIRLANRNHYWTAADIQVTASLVNDSGGTTAAHLRTLGSSRLGPQQSDTWEYVLPPGGWQAAPPVISFRWLSPGG